MPVTGVAERLATLHLASGIVTRRGTGLQG